MTVTATIAGRGRPLRFLALVSGGWVMLRIGLVWQATGSLPEAVRGVLPVPQRAIAAIAPVERKVAVVVAASGGTPVAVRVIELAVPRSGFIDPARVRLALLAMTRVGGAVADDQFSAFVGTDTVRPGQSPASAPLRVASPSRLSVSSWMIARGGTGLGATLQSPQLGGTQGGVRVDYAVTRGIAATMRVAAPAAGAGRELSLGVAWRPAGVPVRVVAEQRLALDGGRSGPALGVSGGVSELALPIGFRLEGYGQAGAILRDGVERYVDASLRAARPVAAMGGIPLDAGGGVWGGAQRGVARVDIGPSIGARVPLAGQRVRVALDWRYRIAGNARPGSGPALSLGADF